MLEHHDHTIAESLFSLYENKFVEIYCGTSKSVRHSSDEDFECKELIRGFVRGVSGSILILEIKFGNMSKLISINSWQIYTVMEISTNPIDFKTTHIYWNEQDHYKFFNK